MASLLSISFLGIVVAATGGRRIEIIAEYDGARVPGARTCFSRGQHDGSVIERMRSGPSHAAPSAFVRREKPVAPELPITVHNVDTTRPVTVVLGRAPAGPGDIFQDERLFATMPKLILTSEPRVDFR